MTDDPFSHPVYRPTLLLHQKAGELIWTLDKDGGWSADLQFLGESWGWMARIYHGGDFRLGGRFTLKVDATAWAQEIREEIESDRWVV